MPVALVNFQAWLAAQGLRVQDGILPEDNITDSLNSAWFETSSSASSQASSLGSNNQVTTLVVAPLVLHNVINVDVTVSAVTWNVSISVEGNELATVLTSDLIPRNVFTAYLSRSIMSVVATFGPWSVAYGLPPLEFQTPSPRTIL